MGLLRLRHPHRTLLFLLLLRKAPDKEREERDPQQQCPKARPSPEHQDSQGSKDQQRKAAIPVRTRLLKFLKVKMHSLHASTWTRLMDLMMLRWHMKLALMTIKKRKNQKKVRKVVPVQSHHHQVPAQSLQSLCTSPQVTNLKDQGLAVMASIRRFRPRSRSKTISTMWQTSARCFLLQSAMCRGLADAWFVWSCFDMNMIFVLCLCLMILACGNAALTLSYLNWIELNWHLKFQVLKLKLSWGSRNLKLRVVSFLFLLILIFILQLYNPGYFGDLAVRTLASNLNDMQVLTLYSGLGGAELSMQMLWRQTCNYIEKNLPLVNVPQCPLNVAASDIDPVCQSVLNSHADPPQHIVADLCDFIDPDVLSRRLGGFSLEYGP